MQKPHGTSQPADPRLALVALVASILVASWLAAARSPKHPHSRLCRRR